MQANNFGEYLRKIRKQRNLTIRQIETYSGISNSYLSQVETGKRGIPSPDILKKIAPVLRVPYEDLMTAAGYIDNTVKETSNEYSIDLPLDHDIEFFRKIKHLPKESQEWFIKQYKENTEFLKKKAEAEIERLKKEKGEI